MISYMKHLDWMWVVALQGSVPRKKLLGILLLILTCLRSDGEELRQQHSTNSEVYSSDIYRQLYYSRTKLVLPYSLISYFLFSLNITSLWPYFKFAQKEQCTIWAILPAWFWISGNSCWISGNSCLSGFYWRIGKRRGVKVPKVEI